MGKHTMGGWVVKHSEKNTAYNVIGTLAGQKYKIARCPYLVVSDSPIITERERDEAEANAKLISAAPDLLQALQSLLELYPYSKTLEQTASKIKAYAAIKKATE